MNITFPWLNVYVVSKVKLSIEAFGSNDITSIIEKWTTILTFVSET